MAMTRARFNRCAGTHSSDSPCADRTLSVGGLRRWKDGAVSEPRRFGPPPEVTLDAVTLYRVVVTLRMVANELETRRGKGPGRLVEYNPGVDAVRDLVDHLVERLPETYRKM